MNKTMTVIAFLVAGNLFAQNTNTAKTVTTADTNTAKMVTTAMHMPMMKSPYVIGLDPDVSFLSNMIPHHQGAIDSAKIMLKSTKDKEVLTIASNIIKVQEAEIKEFKTLIDTLKIEIENRSAKNPNIKNYDKEAQGSMTAMMNSMTKTFKLTGFVDKDFLASMVIHHQGAVNVSKQILKYTKDARIKKIAETIVTAQEKEIKQFQTILAK